MSNYRIELTIEEIAILRKSIDLFIEHTNDEVDCTELLNKIEIEEDRVQEIINFKYDELKSELAEEDYKNCMGEEWKY